MLDDVLDWTTNVGYPGYANAAIDEIYGTWVLNLMFAKAASGAMSPEEALREADATCKRIFAKWKEKGLISPGRLFTDEGCDCSQGSLTAICLRSTWRLAGAKAE